MDLMAPAHTDHPTRINERILGYWQEIKPASGLPLESQVDLNALQDVWDHCLLLRVDTKSEEIYTYYILGKALIAAYGDDWSGKSVCERLLYPHPKPLFDAFGKVCASGEPFSEENEFTNKTGVNIKYRSCFVPLARSEGGKAAYILGGMKWKAY